MGNVTNVLVMRKEQAYKLREYFNAEGELDSLKASISRARTIIATIKCNLLVLSPELGLPEPGGLADYVKDLV